MAGRFELNKDSAGRFRSRWKAGNRLGTVVDGNESVRRHAHGAALHTRIA